MTTPGDLEQKKEFVGKMVQTHKKIQVLEAQISVLQKLFRHVHVTRFDISRLPPGTKTYESIGRMFVLTDIKEVKRNLRKRELQLVTRCKNLENNKMNLEICLKETQDCIREMACNKKTE